MEIHKNVPATYAKFNIGNPNKGEFYINDKGVVMVPWGSQKWLSLTKFKENTGKSPEMLMQIEKPRYIYALTSKMFQEDSRGSVGTIGITTNFGSRLDPYLSSYPYRKEVFFPIIIDVSNLSTPLSRCEALAREPFRHLENEWYYFTTEQAIEKLEKVFLEKANEK